MLAGNMTPIKYHVHAELMEYGIAGIAPNASQLENSLKRSLNRMERVAAVYLGQIEKRLTRGLQIAFDTAEAAVLGACEMQQRFAALPALSSNRLALRIGIHPGIELKRSRDRTDSAMEIASLLAVVDDGILITDVVYSALNPELRILAHPMNDSPPPVAAYAVDWRQDVPSTGFGIASGWPATLAATITGRRFILRHNLKTIELNDEKPTITIGRDPINDLVITGKHVSRKHCRIDRGPAGIVLTDTSANGTFVSPGQGNELRVLNSLLLLSGRGFLMLGRQSKGDRRGGIMYEAFSGA